MVLETFLEDATNKPLHLFFIGGIFTTVAIIIATVLFPDSPSFPVVVFMTLPCIYIFTNKLNKTSKGEIRASTYQELFNANSDIMEMYLFVFMGMLFAITLWFSFLPESQTSLIFSEQLHNLHMINSALVTGNAVSTDAFMTIAMNNIRLVVIIALLSFLFGAGSTIILSWNATVVGVAVGLVVKKVQAAGSSLPVAFAKGLPIGMSYYILHLIPEIVAYFFAAIAGALISSAMTRYSGSPDKIKRLFIIAAGLLAASLVIIFLAAMIEISISYMIQMQKLY
jgi:uncharacterized membrane protein SpoIIM required for sporulation